MLSKDEESKLVWMTDSITRQINPTSSDPVVMPIKASELLWLATKLKEVNDDLKFLNEQNTGLSKKLFKYTKGHEDA
jgi:hypothetical protein